MNFTVKCWADYGDNLTNIDLPESLKELFNKFRELPENVTEVIFANQQGWDTDYYEDFLNKLPTGVTNGISLECQEIMFQNILKDTYESHNNYYFVIKPGNVSIYTEIPVDYILGLIEEPFLDGDTKAQTLVFDRVISKALDNVNNAFNYKTTDLKVESISYNDDGQVIEHIVNK